MPRPETASAGTASAGTASAETASPETASPGVAARHTWRFEAIGAPWAITTDNRLDPDLAVRVLTRIDDFDLTWSRFRSDSLVTTVARRPGTYEFPAEAPALFDLYRRLYVATHGSASPLVGRRLEHLGYDAAYSFTVSADPAGVPAWDDRAIWDGVSLTTTEPVVLDVGAAGKGYLVDLIAGLLDEAGIRDYVVDASGDLRHRGDEPVRVALEHPFDPTLAVGVVTLQNQAICASAANRRTWGDGLHHVLDATTGEPTTDVIATWAVSPTALEADGLATALFFAAPGSLARDFEVEGVRILGSGHVDASAHFEGELFA